MEAMSAVGLAIGVMSVLGGAMGLGLAVASKRFAVEQDPRVKDILEALPGANCGACGFPGCQGYAQAIVDGKAECNLCAPGGADLVGRLASIMGTTATAAEPRIAVLHCQGHEGNCASDARYVGVQSCRACQILAGGTKKCPHGCLGLGDCVDVCPFDAIHMGPDRLPVVDEAACTACGKCVDACPRLLISLEPTVQRTIVRCRNAQKGAVAAKVCTTACIACKKCEKACPFDAIHVKDNVASIDSSKCRNCGMCAPVCPKHCILDGAADVRRQAYIQDTCTGCGACVTVCPTTAISGQEGERHEVNPVKCVGCEACIAPCPVGAIMMRDTK